MKEFSDPYLLKKPMPNLISIWGGSLRYISWDGSIKNCADELNRLEMESSNGQIIANQAQANSEIK